ncbi:hypothetical protein HRI_000996300 [Hibiscus trionum]|uniref:S1 motif domain-containing protein n=1 Tax=Hibiscus trionum TaxID=183268 RepID=A0A9W7HCG2_HIBTR|nr:hypothetical protein HRI_000996300 [Hibiscus trionum]
MEAFDEEEDSDTLDQFEADGFIVLDDEEVEEEENDQVLKGKKTKKKKRKRRSMKDLVLDEDDIELLQENRISGICQFPKETEKFKRLKKNGKSSKEVEQSGFSDDEGLFDELFGEEGASFGSGNYEMTDFIVDDGKSYGEGSSTRWLEINQKKWEQVVTICSPALDNYVLIDDDANETPNHRMQVQASKVNLDSSSEFEPFFLADKYTTERDDHVREADIPERMQMVEEITGPPPLDKRSIEEETSWILNQLVMNPYLLFCKKRTAERSILLNKIKKEDIMKFLELHHVEKFDVPFIAMYRKEQCMSLLDDLEQTEAENEDNDAAGQSGKLKWHKVLWVIKELDKMWLLLQKRKSVLQMHQRKIYDEECLKIDNSERFALNKQLFESISKSLNEAETQEEIGDVDAKFSLHFLSAVEKMDGKFKRPIRKSHYGNCMKAGLRKLASQFWYASEQLSLQIALEKMGMEFRYYPDESPEEIALNFICAMFETPQLVLKGARHMAALELSCEPCIKKHIRRIFRDKAVVSTRPTAQGNVTIDCFHRFSSIKWLCDKPLSEFNDAQWLFIQKAEEEELLQVSIKLPESTLNKLFTGFNEVYLIDGPGRSAQLWKEQYKLILHDAFFNFLLPSMEKEARNLLTTRAKHWLLMECGKELWKIVSVGPYSCNVNILGSVESLAPKVMACCWGFGKPATTFVMLDSSGLLLDTLEARSFSLRSQNIDDQQRKKYDWQRVLKFMKTHQPDVIVIGATNASCVRLKDDVNEIISKVEESLRDIGQATKGISVVFGDESLPQLYEHSPISTDQLPEQPGIVKRAVALGRYLQNPLAMVATLCGANKEIVSLKLSSSDNFLTPDEKYEMIEQVMVDVTNQVGVDINFAVKHDWYFPLLQFVSGLGPRKASILQREASQYRAVNSRKELASFGLKTIKVFHNAVGFLCVRSIRLPCTSLDGSRVHPESYELAERLAVAACNNITEAPIEYVKKEPQVLSMFDINSFSDNYENMNGENRRETFYHIKAELLHGFLDPRKPYKAPSLDEEFNMICGKNGTVVAEGRFIQAIVRHVRPQQVFCVLDSGLTGIIMKDDFSDEGDDCPLQNKLHEGDNVLCKIKQIDKSKFQALLTCKESEMKKTRHEDINEIDPFYHEGGIIPLNQQKKICVEEKLGKKHFLPRTITHPCFRNMTMDEAMEFLSDKDAGESIFRPSSRGTSFLTLTLKVFNELYVNKDIAESGKDHNDITSLLQLGKTLKIGDEAFGNLDEVMDRYVAPVVKHLKEMLGFRKFKRGLKAEVDEVLRAEKAEYPSRIVYYFGVSYEHPGTFILSYIRTINLHHEYIGLLPNGFRFRKRIFGKIEHLVGYFQRNVDALQHKSPALESLAIRNSSGPYTGDGRQGQFNHGEVRGVSKGRNHRDGEGDEDVVKKHPSGIPRPRNGSGCVSSGVATKCGNDIDFASNNEDLPGGWSSGGNWDKNDGFRNSEWSKRGGRKRGQSGDNGIGDDSASGWGSTENVDSLNNGVWHARENNAPGGFRGRSGGRCSSSWGGNKQGQSSGDSFDTSEGGWHARGNNISGRGRSGGSWGGDDGVWNTTGDNVGEFGHSGGHGYGGRNDICENHRGGRRGSARSGRGTGGRGRGYGRGNASGNNVGGRWVRGSHGWGGTEGSGSHDAEGDSYAAGNNYSRNWHTGGGRGRSGSGGGNWGGDGVWNSTGTNVGECGHRGGHGYGGRNGNRNSHRGGRRGSARSSRERGRGYGRGDNSGGMVAGKKLY